MWYIIIIMFDNIYALKAKDRWCARRGGTHLFIFVFVWLLKRVNHFSSDFVGWWFILQSNFFYRWFYSVSLHWFDWKRWQSPIRNGAIDRQNRECLFFHFVWNQDRNEIDVVVCRWSVSGLAASFVTSGLSQVYTTVSSVTLTLIICFSILLLSCSVWIVLHSGAYIIIIIILKSKYLILGDFAYIFLVWFF